MKKTIVLFLLAMLATVQVFAGGEGEKKGSATITMWTQNWGEDVTKQEALMAELTSRFEKETGIKVQVEIGNWTEAARKWMLVSTGGDHPDTGDMYFGWSNVQIGKGKHGPMALDQYKDQLHHDRFIPSTLADVTYNGHVYGIPWRVDIRPLLYRTDLFAEAGIAAPPDTWDDLVTYGKKLTKKGADGRIEIQGLILNTGYQEFCHWIWQGGGEVMTMDAKTATLNTPEVIDSMQFVRDLMYKHEIITKDMLDPSYNAANLWHSGRAAIQPMGSMARAATPAELLANITTAIPTKGKRRTAYSGAGFFGVLNGTGKVEESVKWIEFLSRDENLLKCVQVYGQLSPSINVNKDPYFTDDPWMREVAKCLEFAHTSQSPSTAWGQIAGTTPGSPLKDFFDDVLKNREAIPDLAKKYNAVVQQMMDRANANL
jgi:multiple sugar transport system substrate-binding protein